MPVLGLPYHDIPKERQSASKLANNRTISQKNDSWRHTVADPAMMRISVFEVKVMVFSRIRVMEVRASCFACVTGQTLSWSGVRGWNKKSSRKKILAASD